MQIWNLANLRAGRTLNQHEFYIALRFLTIAQAGLPLNYTSFMRVMQRPTMPFFASFPGIPTIPNPRPRQQGTASPAASAASVTSAASGGAASRSGASGGLWAVPPQAVPKYLEKFALTDLNKDGYVEAKEAAALFQSSGLDGTVRYRALRAHVGLDCVIQSVVDSPAVPVQALRSIWRLCDVDKDKRLDRAEFIIGMHLVVMCHRLKQPPPPQLPPELSVQTVRAVMQQASGGAASMPAATSSAAAQASAPAPAPAPSPAPAPAPAPKPMSLDDAFAGMGAATNAPMPSVDGPPALTNGGSSAAATSAAGFASTTSAGSRVSAGATVPHATPTSTMRAAPTVVATSTPAATPAPSPAPAPAPAASVPTSSTNHSAVSVTPNSRPPYSSNQSAGRASHPHQEVRLQTLPLPVALAWHATL